LNIRDVKLSNFVVAPQRLNRLDQTLHGSLLSVIVTAIVSVKYCLSVPWNRI